jgi:hypothetical protein
MSLPMNSPPPGTCHARTWALALVVAIAALGLLGQWVAQPIRQTGRPNMALRGCVLINHAPKSTLTLLPGIGPATAQHLIDHRQAHGLFQSPADLEAVHNIGPVRRRRMTPWISFATASRSHDAGIRLSATAPPR